MSRILPKQLKTSRNKPGDTNLRPYQPFIGIPELTGLIENQVPELNTIASTPSDPTPKLRFRSEDTGLNKDIVTWAPNYRSQRVANTRGDYRQDLQYRKARNYGNDQAGHYTRGRAKVQNTPN